MSDPETLAVYEARAADYAERFQDSAPDGTLRRFIAGLAPGARVLDLGCGPGGASAHMAAAGLRPDPVDASPAMVRLAREAHGLPARIAVFEAALDGTLYEGVWANFSLLHAPEADLPGLVARLGAALVPGGLCHLGMKVGTGSRRDGLGRLYSYARIEDLKAWLAEGGVLVDWEKAGEQAGLAGTLDPFVVMQGRRGA